MDNDRSALRSNKEFSSELQVINGFETPHLTRPNDEILTCGFYYFFRDDLELVGD